MGSGLTVVIDLVIDAAIKVAACAMITPAMNLSLTGVTWEHHCAAYSVTRLAGVYSSNATYSASCGGATTVWQRIHRLNKELYSMP